MRLESPFNFIRVRAYDPDGNGPSIFSNGKEVLYITEGPELTYLNPADGDILSSASQVTATLTQIDSAQVSSGSTIEVLNYLGSPVAGTQQLISTTQDSKTFRYSFSPPGDGTYLVRVTGEDQLSPQNAKEYESYFTLNSNAPVITVTSPNAYPYYAVESQVGMVGHISSANEPIDARLSVGGEQVQLELVDDGFADPDHDGLDNFDEARYGTDPALADTDGDGFLDGGEITSSTNPTDPGSQPVDRNGDSVDDFWEALYVISNLNANPDGDGLSNRQEYLYNTNPLDPDTDGDGANDAPHSGTGVSNQFMASVPLSGGRNLVVVEATDSLGNEASSSYTIIVKPASSGITIQSPEEGDVFYTRSISVDGNYHDDYLDRIEIWRNGELVDTVDSPYDDQFTSEVQLADGSNTITAIKHDLFGESATDSVTVSYDPLSLPIIPLLNAVQSPVPDPHVFVSGMVTYVGGAPVAGGEVEVFLNGRSAGRASLADDGSFFAQVTLRADYNLVEVSAYDADGNGPSQMSQAREILWVQDAPRLAELSPEEGAVLRTLTEATAVLTEVDSAGINQALSILSVIDSAGNYVGSLMNSIASGENVTLELPLWEVLDDGVYTVEVMAADNIQNIRRYVSTFRIDTSAPVIHLNYPSEAVVYTTTPSLDVYGRVETDYPPVEVYLGREGALEPAVVMDNAFGDTDNDGLTNYRESVLGTNPALADSDGDGFLDAGELTSGTDPLNPSSSPADADGDGMDDEWEALHDAYDPVADQDGDGLLNRGEYGYGFDPNDPTSYRESKGSGMPNEFASTVQLEEGENTVVIRGVDGLANSGERRLTVILKPQGSSMRIISPSQGYVSVYPDITVEGVYDDDFIDRIELFRDGELLATALPYDGSFVFGVRLDAGENHLTVRERDLFGETLEDSVTVFYDDTPTEAELVGDNPYFTRASNIEISGAITSVREYYAWVRHTYLGQSGLTTSYYPIQTSGQFAVEVPLYEGENLVEVRVNDSLEITSSGVLHIVRDTTQPEVRVTAPEDGDIASVSTSSQLGGVAGTYEDYFQSLTDFDQVDTIERIQFFRNSELIATELSPYNNLFFQDMPLREGPNRLEVHGLDMMGNIGMDEVTVEIDRTPPTIGVSSLTGDPGRVVEGDGTAFLTNSQSVEVRGYYIDENIGTVTVGDTQADLNGGTFSASVRLQEGDNEVAVLARDLAGLESYPVTLSIFLDSTPPTVSIVEPSSLRTTDDTPYFAAATDEEAQCSITYFAQYLDDYFEQPMSTQDGLYHTATADYRLPSQFFGNAESDFTITCTDELGNEGSEHYDIVVDGMAPQLTGFASTNGILQESTHYRKSYMVLADSITQLTVDASEPVRCRYGPTTDYNSMTPFADGGLYELHPRSGYILLDNRQNYTYYLTCEDLSGQRSEARIIDLQVFIDMAIQLYNVRPTGYINDPTPTVTVETAWDAQCLLQKHSPQFVSYWYETNRGLTEAVNTQMFKEKEGNYWRHSITLESTADPSEHTPLEEDGNYRFTVACFDPFGQLDPGSVDINFTIDTVIEPPVIAYPHDGDIFTHSYIEVNGTAERYSTVRVYVQNQLQDILRLQETVELDSDEFAVFIGLKEGDNTIIVRSIDRAGNFADTNITVGFTNLGPRVDIAVEPAGGVVNELDDIVARFTPKRGDPGTPLDLSRTEIIFTRIRVNPHIDVPGETVINAFDRMTYTPTERPLTTKGTYKIAVIPRDAQGNEGEVKVVNLGIDPLAPEISVESPTVDRTRDPLVVFSGAVSRNPDYALLIVYDQFFRSETYLLDLDSEGRFNETVSLSDGPNYFVIRSEVSGNEGETPERTIYLDRVGPQIIRFQII